MHNPSKQTHELKHTSIRAARLLGTALLGTVLLGAACLASVTTGCSRKDADSPHAISPWVDRMQSLFEDSIDPVSVGLPPTTTDPTDANIARGQAAHSVLRTRVNTIIADDSGPIHRYVIELRIIGEPIVGPRQPSDTLVLTASEDSPSYGLLRSKGLQLAGARFIAFLREFPNETPRDKYDDDYNEVVVHWYLARDTPETISAARKGAALGPDTE